ncbi:VOC family protein [Ursidibacter sp. B-7004-1]
MILKNPIKNFDFANFLSKMTAYFGDISQFEQKIQQIAQVIGLDLSKYSIDHLAVRMNNVETAQQWRYFLLADNSLLKESDVNGRPISLIKLVEPLIFCGQKVSIIELPFPKDKVYPEEGWEHIEVVIPFIADESVEQWIKRIELQFELPKKTQICYKISQPKVLGERLPNPSIAITLKDATNRNNCCLKVHPYDINTIICSENNF